MSANGFRTFRGLEETTARVSAMTGHEFNESATPAELIRVLGDCELLGTEPKQAQVTSGQFGSERDVCLIVYG
jgi:hypothetical protein